MARGRRRVIQQPLCLVETAHLLALGWVIGEDFPIDIPNIKIDIAKYGERRVRSSSINLFSTLLQFSLDVLTTKTELSLRPILSFYMKMLSRR